MHNHLIETGNTEMERAATYQKMARIFAAQGNQTDAAKMYAAARALMGVKDSDQVYS